MPSVGSTLSLISIKLTYLMLICAFGKCTIEMLISLSNKLKLLIAWLFKQKMNGHLYVLLPNEVVCNPKMKWNAFWPLVGLFRLLLSQSNWPNRLLFRRRVIFPPRLTKSTTDFSHTLTSYWWTNLPAGVGYLHNSLEKQD